MRYMKKNNVFIMTFFVLASIIGLQSCATVFGGRQNTLVFKADSLHKAQVYIDDEYIGDAPGKIKLKKTKIQHGSTLEIKSEGYETKKYLILRRQSKIYTILDVLTGGVWLGIDYSTGNIYRPSPRVFNYDLNKSE